MKFIKREGPHIIVGFKAEELDLIRASLKKARQYAPPSVDIVRVVSLARTMVKGINGVLGKDKYWKEKKRKK